MTIALPARAKLNLDLEVLARRDDGFHELRTTYQAIDLHDLLEMSPAESTSLTTSGLEVQVQQKNTVLLAHQLLEEQAKRTLPTRFHLHKRIPPGSGLGGASSDAAAALRGMARIHKVDVDLDEVARQVGADVPFFLTGGAARAEGRGERLEPIETEVTWYALAWPRIELKTADVYRAWDDLGELDELDEMRHEAPNHLRRAAEKVEPRLEEFAGKLGAQWQMTGSGSAFFKRCTNKQEATEAIARLDCWTAVAHSAGAW